MLLSGEEIQKNLGGNIIIEPYHPLSSTPTATICACPTSCWSTTPTPWT